MRTRLWFLAALFALSGCQCFVPVDECHGNKCLHKDGGIKDGGHGDAGVDAGVDAGAPTCALWDGGGVGKCAAVTGYVATATSCLGECVLYPISVSGIHPTLPACIGCGCDTKKFTANTPANPVSGPNSFCDRIQVFTAPPNLLAEAFPGFDAGAACVPNGAVDFECTVYQRQTGTTIGDAGFARACGATLVPGVREVQCQVFIK